MALPRRCAASLRLAAGRIFILSVSDPLYRSKTGGFRREPFGKSETLPRIGVAEPLVK
jgi:hypothetical protein